MFLYFRQNENTGEGEAVTQWPPSRKSQKPAVPVESESGNNFIARFNFLIFSTDDSEYEQNLADALIHDKDPSDLSSSDSDSGE
jgi:hypothetical protein